METSEGKALKNILADFTMKGMTIILWNPLVQTPIV
jgi:hypothetical protein